MPSDIEVQQNSVPVWEFKAREEISTEFVAFFEFVDICLEIILRPIVAFYCFIVCVLGLISRC